MAEKAILSNDILEDKQLLEKVGYEVHLKIMLQEYDYEYLEEIEVEEEVLNEIGNKIGWTKVKATLKDGREQTFYVETSKLTGGVENGIQV